jgi:hypothetical protein
LSFVLKPDFKDVYGHQPGVGSNSRFRKSTELNVI